MEIEGRLNSNDLRSMADQLRNYKASLKDKIRIFVLKLADKGILAAIQTGGKFDKYLIFSKETVTDGVVIVARETQTIKSTWLKYGQEVSAEVSPLLMAEFGAGPHAVIWEGAKRTKKTLPDRKKIGRGTFPNQTHAFEDSWWYMDLNYEWHQARGVKPTRPLHNAVLEMILQVKEIAREVFGDGSI